MIALLQCQGCMPSVTMKDASGRLSPDNLTEGSRSVTAKHDSVDDLSVAIFPVQDYGPVHAISQVK